MPLRDSVTVGVTDEHIEAVSDSLPEGEGEDVGQKEVEPALDLVVDGQKDPVPLIDEVADTLRVAALVGDSDDEVETDRVALFDGDNDNVAHSVGDPEPDTVAETQ